MRENAKHAACGGTDFCLEAGALLEYLESGERVLAVGCGDGRLALECALRKNIRILGLDDDPKMIEAAQANRYKVRLRLQGTAKFEAGDVAKLEFCREIFDKVAAFGSLTGLAEAGRLEAAVAEWSRVLKPGGLLLTAGDSAEGRENLNRFREEWGLDPLPEPKTPSPLDPELLLENPWPDLELVETRDFSSTYDVMTQVFKPLLAASHGYAEAGWPGELERFAAGLPAWGEYGRRRLYVFRRLPQAAESQAERADGTRA